MNTYSNIISILTAYIILVIFASGCTNQSNIEIPEAIRELDNLTVYSSENQPSDSLSLVRDVAYGDTDEAILGSIILSTGIDGQGRVYIADYSALTIHVYNPDGTYLKGIGREGKGPGEFLSLRDMAIGNGKLHVLDYDLFRISVFDLNTLEYERDFSISMDFESGELPSWVKMMRNNDLFYRVTDIFLREDGKYLALFSDQDIAVSDNLPMRTYEVSLYDPSVKSFTKHGLLSFKWTGGVLLYERNNSTMVLRWIPYKRHSVFDFKNDFFVHSWTEDLLFKFYDKNGNYLRAIYYDHPKVELTLDDALSLYDADHYKTAIRNDEDLPETWPAFNGLVMDDQNQLWVATFTENPADYEWWVLNEQGERLGIFTWPRERELAEVKNGYAYALETAGDGTKEVVRYSVEGL